MVIFTWLLSSKSLKAVRPRVYKIWVLGFTNLYMYFKVHDVNDEIVDGGLGIFAVAVILTAPI